jgi:hypothetical protein
VIRYHLGFMGPNVLVATGSIYFLMLIAARDLRVRVANLRQDTIDSICNALRWPKQGKS